MLNETTTTRHTLEDTAPLYDIARKCGIRPDADTIKAMAAAYKLGHETASNELLDGQAPADLEALAYKIFVIRERKALQESVDDHDRRLAEIWAELGLYGPRN